MLKSGIQKHIHSRHKQVHAQLASLRWMLPQIILLELDLDQNFIKHKLFYLCVCDLNIYLDFTVHGAGQQEMTRLGKQSDCTDTLENKQRN